METKELNKLLTICAINIFRKPERKPTILRSNYDYFEDLMTKECFEAYVNSKIKMLELEFF